MEDNIKFANFDFDHLGDSYNVELIKSNITKSATNIYQTLEDKMAYSYPEWLSRIDKIIEDCLIDPRHFYGFLNLTKDRFCSNGKIHEYVNKYKKAISFVPARAIVSVKAYFISVDKKNHCWITNLFEKYSKDLIDLFKENEFKRSFADYNLSCEDFLIYKKCFALLLSSYQNSALRQELELALSVNYEVWAAYVETYKKILNDEENYKEFPRDELYILSPFIKAYISDVKAFPGETNVALYICVMSELLNCGDELIDNVLKIMFLRNCAVTYELVEIGYKAINKVFNSFNPKDESSEEIKKQNEVKHRITPRDFYHVLISSPVYFNARNTYANVIRYITSLSSGKFSKLFTSFLIHKYNMEYFDKGTDIEDFSNRLSFHIDTFFLNLDDIIDSEKPLDKYPRKLTYLSLEFGEMLEFINHYMQLPEKEKLDEILEVVEKDSLTAEVVVEDTEPINSEEADEIALLRNELAYYKQVKANEKSLLSEIANLKKENKNLKKTIEDSKEGEKELIALRNYIYEIELDTNNTKTDSEEDVNMMIDYLNCNVRGVFIGGVDSLRLKLEKLLPKWKKYPPKKIIDKSVIVNSDYVFYYPKYLDHASYNANMSVVKTHSCNVAFTFNENLDKLIRFMYDKCKEAGF